MRAFAFPLAAAAMLVTVEARAASDVTQSGFTPAFLGVDTETAGVAASHANIVRIDLTAPGIRFRTTPLSGTLQTTAQPLTQFVQSEKLQVAINANFFAPCCSTAPQPEALTGLAVDQGHVIAPPSYTVGASPYVLAITRDNHARILQLTGPNSLDLADVYSAVAGSAIVVSNGENVGASSPDQGDPLDPNPRTLVGLSANGRFLYFVTIDGRVTGYSVGTTNTQSADLMIAIGCAQALNLDGGGSTELVTAMPSGSPFVVNNPSGGAEREDGSAIGLTAIALPSQTVLDYGVILQLLREIGFGG